MFLKHISSQVGTEYHSMPSYIWLLSHAHSVCMKHTKFRFFFLKKNTHTQIRAPLQSDTQLIVFRSMWLRRRRQSLTSSCLPPGRCSSSTLRTCVWELHYRYSWTCCYIKKCFLNKLAFCWTFFFVYFVSRTIHILNIPTKCWLNFIVVCLIKKSTN